NRMESDPGVRTVSRNSLGTFSTPPGAGVGGSNTAPRFSWVFEFYNPARDHYFLTQSRAEFHVLDVGCFPGWIITVPGGFNAKLASAPPLEGYGAACRYYGRPEAGLDSHFYSASAYECAEVARRYPDA